MTTKKRFTPLRARHGLVPTDYSTLVEDVPDYLLGPLWDWCASDSRLTSDYLSEELNDQARMLCVSLRIPSAEYLDELKAHTEDEPAVLLDMVDWILASEHDRATTDWSKMKQFKTSCKQLDDLLFHGTSVWQVADPPNQLARRVSPELVSDFGAASGPNDLASNHLSLAWDAAWGRAPNPSEAFKGAVNAVEAALGPTVTPDDPRPSLGKMIAAIRDKPEKWDSRFGDSATVKMFTDLISTLWTTHSRHSDAPTNTIEEAQDAVTIAVAVVSLLRRGFLKQRNNS